MTSEHCRAGFSCSGAALAAWLALAATAGGAVAGPFEDAQAAEKRDNYETAIPIYRSLADKGHAGAQMRLGRLYEVGLGVKPDWLEAARWYGKAADTGDADGVRALSQLGRSWVFRHPGASDAAIYALVETQARKGYSAAQWSLGVMNYRFGAPSPEGRKNAVEAVAWYRRAAERGHPDAQASLAAAYADGTGVTQELVQAYRWYDLAAASIPAPRRRQNFEELRADLIKQRNAVARKMTRAQIAEAQSLAKEWRPKPER